MRKLRIAALVREGLVPPETFEGFGPDNTPEWKMECDVVATLSHIGHEVRALGVYDDLGPIRETILQWKPHVAFMMLEEFLGISVYDQAIVSYLELMQQHYTGCNPRGLLLTHDKALSKKIMQFHRIPTPRFVVFAHGRKVKPPSRLRYPIFVKSAIEDASYGISQASVVTNDQALLERVKFVHEHAKTDAIAEEYIDGRELYVGVVGNHRLQTLPIWEMHFSRMPEELARIATAQVKWNPKYQKKHGIETRAAEDISPEMRSNINRLCKRVYRALNMSGYGRIDLRLSPDGQVYVLEANANPNLEFGEDFAESAESGGISYEDLLQRIVNLGLRYSAPWKQ